MYNRCIQDFYYFRPVFARYIHLALDEEEQYRPDERCGYIHVIAFVTEV